MECQFDIRVICLQEKTDLLYKLEQDFKGCSVQEAPAVNMRGVSSHSLVHSRLISLSAADSLDKGRKWHKELPSPGTAGLHQTNRLLLSAGEDSILVFEEDCKYNSERLRKEVFHLLRLGDSFDVALFNSQFQTKNIEYDRAPGPWLRLLGGEFMGTHCVFYSRAGRRKMAEYLQWTQEVQIDYFIAMLASRGLLEVYLHDNSKSVAWQAGFTTTLQTDACVMCYISPTVIGQHLGTIASLLVLLFLAIYLKSHMGNRAA